MTETTVHLEVLSSNLSTAGGKKKLIYIVSQKNAGQRWIWLSYTTVQFSRHLLSTHYVQPLLVAGFSLIGKPAE
jgi:hypothetical protein